METIPFINWFDMSFCNNTNNTNNTNKQTILNKIYVDKYDKRLKKYMKEKNRLTIKYNKINLITFIRSKQLQYFNDKLVFKNVHNSTSNFIALNSCSLKNYIDYNTNIYNHYHYILTMIQHRISYIDFQINTIKSNIYT